jgi:peroxiredoxin
MALACGGLGATDYGDCPDYIACSEDLGIPTASLEASYGEEGLCWEEEDHLTCRAACADGLDLTCPSDQSDACDAIVGTGNAVGDVAMDFTVPTQNPGESFRLHEHCDSVVLLVISAMWDGAVKGESAALESLHQDRRGDGLVVVLLLGENESGETPSQQELRDYADEHNLTFTVGADADFEIEDRFRVDNGVPSFTLIDRGSVVYLADDYFARDSISDLL